jgi:hypothetical protein
VSVATSKPEQDKQSMIEKIFQRIVVGKIALLVCPESIGFLSDGRCSNLIIPRKTTTKEQ